MAGKFKLTCLVASKIAKLFDFHWSPFFWQWFLNVIWQLDGLGLCMDYLGGRHLSILGTFSHVQTISSAVEPLLPHQKGQIYGQKISPYDIWLSVLSVCERLCLNWHCYFDCLHRNDWQLATLNCCQTPQNGIVMKQNSNSIPCSWNGCWHDVLTDSAMQNINIVEIKFFINYLFTLNKIIGLDEQAQK